MYKVIIVDDETWVTESIKLSIEWSKLDMEVVGVAYSGLEAYDLIMQLSPDIVLTDIRMRNMNGLELIQKVNDACKNVKFIVISGHAEFSYAQKALHAGALGYCLKPIDNNELIRILQKARSFLQPNQSESTFQLFDLVMNYSTGMEDSIKNYMHNLGFKDIEKKGVLPIVCITNNVVEFSKSVHCISDKIGSCKYAFLLQAEETDRLIDQLSGMISSEFTSIGVGTVARSIADIKASLENANLAAYEYFISGNSGVYNLSSNMDGNLDHYISEIEKHLKGGEVEHAITEIQAIPKLFRIEKYNIIHVLYFYNNLIRSILKSPEELIENYLYNFEQLAGRYQNINEMIHFLECMAKKNIEEKAVENVRNINNATFKNIITYVNQNYNRDISVYDLSQKFFINPSYISQLFKKEMGKNFTEYVLSLRIDYAIELLADSSLSLTTVAQKVGYNDYFYFSKVFKKYTGKAPSQYQEENTP